MRGIDCECGLYLEDRDDAALLNKMKQHVDKEHPGRFTEGELRAMRDDKAYDVNEKAAPPIA
jgi:hypothetical protein